MYINIEFEKDLLAEIDDTARRHGMRRPVFIRWAMLRLLRMGYPVVDVDFVCPDCAQGRHCGGGVKETLIDLNSLSPKGKFGHERMLRWVCRCACPAAVTVEVESASISASEA